MPPPNLIAKSVGLEHTETVPLNQVADRVMRGEVIVLPQCMQAIGYFEQLKQASLAGIRQAVGEHKAARVRADGFEAVHTIIELDELKSIIRSNYKIFRSLAPVLSIKIVKSVFQTEKPFYFEAEPNVQFQLPYDEVERTELSSRRGSGKITPRYPHQDSWYGYPTNSINIWIAVGAVRFGNGISLYPQVYGKRLPCTKDGRILSNQYFGRALNFELAPGDAIIFHGEHLHSSELNSTDDTRHVVSLRITLKKPKFQGKSSSQFIYSGFGGEFMALLDRIVAKVSHRMAKLINFSFGRSRSPQRSFDDTSADFPQPLPLETEVGTAFDPANLSFDSSKLKVGEIRPLSPNLCATRLNKNRVVVFSRHCPHQGADLATGYVVDGCVVCPWHNLPFSMNSGASPCQSLPHLTVFEYSQRREKDEWQTPSLC